MIDVPIVKHEPVTTGPNVTAFIDSISIFGEMEIEFNSTMFNNFNWTEFMNKTWIDCYLVPYDPADSLNWTKVNFTWHVYDYQPSRLFVRLKWEDPTYISLKLT